MVFSDGFDECECNFSIPRKGKRGVLEILGHGPSQEHVLLVLRIYFGERPFFDQVDLFFQDLLLQGKSS